MTITISSPVDDRRAALRALIWPSGPYPSTRNEPVDVGISDPYWATLSGLAYVDWFVVKQQHCANVEVYGFRPTSPTNRSIIWHAGHGAVLKDDWVKHYVQRFLTEGLHVAIVNMPIAPGTTLPVVDGVTITNHNLLGTLRTTDWHPLSAFLEPTIAAINYLIWITGRPTVHMTGLSGGGWTTVLMAALDTRIVRSFPVAGSLPLDIRTTPECGDWEQHDDEIYALSSYEDLYIMGSVGPSRRQVQIFNQYDDTCFWFSGQGGPDSNTPARQAAIQGYIGPVNQRAAQLGGTFYGWVDQGQTGHAFSDASIDLILSHLAGT